jgi:hypothetical protein
MIVFLTPVQAQVNAYDFPQDSFTKTSYLKSLKNTVKNMAVVALTGSSKFFLKKPVCRNWYNPE